MKNVFLFLTSFLFLTFTSCEKDTCESEDGIVGEWLLIEELIDPGDGSGTFQPVTSDKEVKFCDDSTFEANGDMCSMTSQSSSPHVGTYDTSTKTFTPENCMSTAPLSYQYSVNGNTLILSYPCIEGCQQKYTRL